MKTDNIIMFQDSSSQLEGRAPSVSDDESSKNTNAGVRTLPGREQRRSRSSSLTEIKDILRRLEGKIHKAAGLELALIDKAMAMREKRQRLVLSRQVISEQLEKETRVT